MSKWAEQRDAEQRDEGLVSPPPFFVGGLHPISSLRKITQKRTQENGARADSLRHKIADPKGKDNSEQRGVHFILDRVESYQYLSKISFFSRSRILKKGERWNHTDTSQLQVALSPKEALFPPGTQVVGGGKGDLPSSQHGENSHFPFLHPRIFHKSLSLLSAPLSSFPAISSRLKPQPHPVFPVLSQLYQ